MFISITPASVLHLTWFHFVHPKLIRIRDLTDTWNPQSTRQ